MPDLEYLEKKFQEERSIVLIGCHSAKFLNERGSAKVRDAVLKYEIKHPVINDDRMVVWRNYERRSWPSIVIVSPKSQIPILILTGEGHRQVLDLFLSVAYDYYYEDLNHEPTFKYHPEEMKQAPTVTNNRKVPETPAIKNANNQNLKYPGKVLCIERQENMPHNLLVISDSANNRILIINEETMQFQDQIGNSKIGLVDGDFVEAQFHHPQGLCHVYRENNHFLYVCDTKNHAIREINLMTKEVLTVIGTGEKGFDKEGNKSPEI